MSSADSNDDASGAIRLEPVELSRPIMQGAEHRAMRQRVSLEMAVVLSFAVLPDLFIAIDTCFSTPSSEMGFVATHAYSVVRSIAVACPLLYIMSKSGTSWSTFGIRRFRPLRDVGAGAVAGLADLFFWLWIVRLLQMDQWNAPAAHKSDAMYAGMRISGIGDFFILLIAIALNSFAEELAMRAYLVPRLEQLFSSTLMAVILSSAVFASYHVYQGAYGVVGALVTGIVLGTSFVILRRLWPLVVAHTLVNLYTAAQVSLING